MANPWNFGAELQFPVPPHAAMPKRPRPDYDFQQPGPNHMMGVPTGQAMANFIPRDDDRAGYHVVKDTKSIGASYDRYLQSTGQQLNSYKAGEASTLEGVGSGRPMGGGMTGMPVGKSVMMGGPGVHGPDMASNGRSMGFGTQFPPADPIGRFGREPPLPPDASNTLFVEGLPADSTRREVSHIFRPFLGFKEVRLVNKEPKHQGGDPLVLCFVDFTSPGSATAALNAVQGYKMDEQDRDSPSLRMQFARYPGPRSGIGPRGKR